MNRKPHLNLLRAHRKESALSQSEIAFLLGANCSSKICRYEQMIRDPELETVLGFEAIFDRPVSELFPGLYAKVEAAVRKRARALAKRVLNADTDARRKQKRNTIAEIIKRKKKTT